MELAQPGAESAAVGVADTEGVSEADRVVDGVGVGDVVINGVGVRLMV